MISHWGISAMNLPGDEVHIWTAWLNLDDVIIQEFRGLLSADELERASRFRSPEAEREFVTARGLLRRLLGAYTGCISRELGFVYNPQGKPSLAPWLRLPHAFNLSHSGGLALFAVGLGRQLGVDVERVIAIAEADSIAQRLFSEEEAQRVRLETERKETIFYSYWTRKEALLKCSGAGISDDAAGKMPPFRGFVWEFTPFAGYQAALAATGEPFTIKTFHWSSDQTSSAQRERVKSFLAESQSLGMRSNG